MVVKTRVECHSLMSWPFFQLISMNPRRFVVSPIVLSSLTMCWHVKKLLGWEDAYYNVKRFQWRQSPLSGTIPFTEGCRSAIASSHPQVPWKTTAAEWDGLYPSIPAIYQHCFIVAKLQAVPGIEHYRNPLQVRGNLEYCMCDENLASTTVVKSKPLRRQIACQFLV